ncbi:virulence factor, Mce family [Streptomyces ipomoeae 91-03]|uniref:Virulence factor, Mce family n=1 Tax=Streptomyces ipomoeae 91-03 TaxID=698759 RepID=L1KZ12_9ACTN|nr:virulence factor, Mce family [Streptomyces ipomoeae 91-03]
MDGRRFTAADGLPVQRLVRRPAPRRSGGGRSRLPRHGRVQGRTGPGPAVGGQGQQRHRGRGREGGVGRLARPGATARRRLGEAARQRGRRAPADQHARREVRGAVRAGRHRARRTAPRRRPRPAVPLSRSGRNPEIEEVLSALSALLNGGGVAQLKTITVELNKALEGRENRVRSLLTELDTFLGGLDGQRADIVRALKGIDRLAKRLRKEKKTIAKAVDTLPPALKVLADQRRDLTRMLTALSKLSKTGTRVVNASRDDTVANLKQLRPILQQLNKAGDDLPNSLELLTTYPFPRNVVDAVKGDYVNLAVTADLDLAGIYGNVKDKPGESGGSGDGDDGSDTPDLPDLPELPDVPGVPTPTAPPGTPEAPGEPSAPTDGDDLLCPPVCTAGYGPRYGPRGDSGRLPAGIDLALAELMLKGIQP